MASDVDHEAGQVPPAELVALRDNRRGFGSNQDDVAKLKPVNGARVASSRQQWGL